VKLIPEDFYEHNLYVLFAEAYGFSPSHVKGLSERELQYFLSAIQGKNAHDARDAAKRKSEIDMQKAKAKNAPKPRRR
jgi:hypothetical protein